MEIYEKRFLEEVASLQVWNWINSVPIIFTKLLLGSGRSWMSSADWLRWYIMDIMYIIMDIMSIR